MLSKMLSRGVMLALGLALAGSVWASQPATSQTKPTVVHAIKHDESPNLRDMRLDLSNDMRRVMRNRHLSKQQEQALQQKLTGDQRTLQVQGPHEVPLGRKSPVGPLRRTTDTALQNSALPKGFARSIPSAASSFDGQGNTMGYYPPDTNMAVGQTYIVQTVNVTFAIYNKSDGSEVMGPTAINSIWSGFGGGCESDNDGDPVVLYDQFAQRWVITQFAVAGPYLECVAVSSTSDPTGSYYRYAFQISSSDLNDYPKLGVWSDGYYAAFNMFGSSFTGVKLAAFERSAMLQGNSAQMVIFDAPGSTAYSILPADVDGDVLPPPGSPEYFVNYQSPNLWGGSTPYGLNIWQMHVDWTTPSSSTLTGPVELDVDPFNDLLCGGSRNCIPQPGGADVDAISDRLMFRLAYRNYGDHEALVVNHTVGADSSGNRAGIRWYEIRDPGGTPAIFQQGTFAPSDSHNRWMGSIAMDASGNMALGYSVSDSSTAPSVWYTGRLVTDTAGTLPQGEGSFVDGGGSQGGSAGRWGDYSSMLIDPVDDCTFWYTTEYYASDSAVGWQTRIGSFKFPTCAKGPQGAISGTITDASDSSPISGALVQVDGSTVTTTGDNGTYSIVVPAGSHDIGVQAYGFDPDSVTLTVNDGDNLTQNFALTAQPKVTLSGHVTDDGHGYGLYAKVNVVSTTFGTVGSVYTNPVDGAYSVDVIAGATYTVNALSQIPGYSDGSASVTVASTNLTQDYVLDVTGACAAPGYAFEGSFGEDFENGVPPTGWSVTDDAGNGTIVWSPIGTFADGNYTGGGGDAADANSDYTNNGAFDTSLITPAINVADLPPSPKLRYLVNYANYAGADELDLDIQVDGGSWTTILAWTDDHGTLYGTPGESVQIDLSSYLSGATSFKLRWRYFDADSGAWDWYAQIDNVAIGVCNPQPGGLIIGHVTDANNGAFINGADISVDNGGATETVATLDDDNLDDGFYIVFGAAGGDQVTAGFPKYQSQTEDVSVSDGVNSVLDIALPAPHMTLSESAIEMDVPVNAPQHMSLTLSNDGSASGSFSSSEVYLPFEPLPSGPFAVHTLRNEGEAINDIKADEKPYYKPPYAAPYGAGNVVSSFDTGLAYPWGVGADRPASTLWVSNLAAAGGDDLDYEFNFDGSPTGNTSDTSSWVSSFAADMAFDESTGLMWQVNVGGDNCIYAFNPDTQQPTGDKICPAFGASQRGLTYDPVSDTFYSGSWNDEIINQFDRSGTLLRSVNVGLSISGLAYNPMTHHMFVMSNQPSSGGYVYVLDTQYDMAMLGVFAMTDGGSDVFADYDQAGLGMDCSGHLWAANQNSAMVYEVNSGESGNCSWQNIPWMTMNGGSGSVDAGANITVDMTLDASQMQPGDTEQGMMRILTDSPYGNITMPVTIHAKPAADVIVDIDSAGQSSATVGDQFTYTVSIRNLGDAMATGVHVDGSLASNLSVDSATPDQGSCSMSSGSLSCDLGNVAGHAGTSITLKVSADSAGSAANSFTLTTNESNGGTGSSDYSVDVQSKSSGGSGGSNSGGDSGGGGGAFGAFMLLALLGFSLAGLRRRRG